METKHIYRDNESYFLPYEFVDDLQTTRNYEFTNLENDNKNINQYSQYSDYLIDDDFENNDNINVGSDIKKIVNKFKVTDLNKKVNQKHKIDKKRKKIKNSLIFNKQHKEYFDNDENNEINENDLKSLFNGTDKEYLIYGVVVGIIVIFIANLIHKIK